MIYIIAEIGVNHNGSFIVAKKLIKAATQAGANAVKIQNFIPEEMILENTQKANYQRKTTSKSETQDMMLKNLMLNNNECIKLKRYAEKNKIDFISTPFDDTSFNFLVNRMNLKTIKISSTDTDNIPFLIKAGSCNKNIILSTGMSTIDDVDLALSALAYGNKKYKKKFDIKKNKKYYLNNLKYIKSKVVLMHCTTEYPAPKDELNLNVIDTYKNRYKIRVGYSDHSCNKLTPVIAASKGISMIEAHITIDKKMIGPDHKSSLSILNFKKYVSDIRETEKMTGSFKKFITKSEKKNKSIARKSLVLKKNIKKNEVITNDHIICKRPSIGISPKYYYDILNKKSLKDMTKNTIIKNTFIKK